MSHEHTVIDLADGLTVLVGPNNCGKSAVVTALQILSHNDPSTYVLRHGQREARILVETDDDHVIQWSRSKNGSPKYLIDGIEYDRLKRGVPKPLREALRLSKVQCEQDEFDVHYGEQKSPVFLLNDPPRAAAQFFASSSDTVRLVEMQSLHKQRVRDSKQEKSRTIRAIAEIDADLKSLEPLEDILLKLDRCETQYQKLQQKHTDIEQMGSLVELIAGTAETISWQSTVSGLFGALSSPPEMGETDALAHLISRFQLTLYEQAQSSDSVGVLDRLENPPQIDSDMMLAKQIEEIRSASTQIDHLNKASKRLADLEPPPANSDDGAIETMIADLTHLISNLANVQKNIEKLDREIQQAYSAVSDWVRNNPLCPTCGQSIRADDLLHIGEHIHG